MLGRYWCDISCLVVSRQKGADALHYSRVVTDGDKSGSLIGPENRVPPKENVVWKAGTKRTGWKQQERLEAKGKVVGKMVES